MPSGVIQGADAPPGCGNVGSAKGTCAKSGMRLMATRRVRSPHEATRNAGEASFPGLRFASSGLRLRSQLTYDVVLVISSLIGAGPAVAPGIGAGNAHTVGHQPDRLHGTRALQVADAVEHVAAALEAAQHLVGGSEEQT